MVWLMSIHEATVAISSPTARTSLLNYGTWEDSQSLMFRNTRGWSFAPRTGTTGGKMYRGDVSSDNFNFFGWRIFMWPFHFRNYEFFKSLVQNTMAPSKTSIKQSFEKIPYTIFSNPWPIIIDFEILINWCLSIFQWLPATIELKAILAWWPIAGIACCRLWSVVTSVPHSALASDTFILVVLLEESSVRTKIWIWILRIFIIIFSPFW